jgi:hypothetical protein
MTLVKLLHSFVALMFMAMAYVQLNDPDPIFWVAAYMSVSLVPLSRLLNYQLISVFYIALGMCLAGLLISAPGFINYLSSQDYASIGGSMAEDKPYIEAAREFLGMLIGVICLMFYRIRPA